MCNRIDGVIGSQTLATIMRDTVYQPDNSLPKAQQSIFGWVISGVWNGCSCHPHRRAGGCWTVFVHQHIYIFSLLFLLLILFIYFLYFFFLSVSLLNPHEEVLLYLVPHEQILRTEKITPSFQPIFQPFVHILKTFPLILRNHFVSYKIEVNKARSFYTIENQSFWF